MKRRLIIGLICLVAFLMFVPLTFMVMGSIWFVIHNPKPHEWFRAIVMGLYVVLFFLANKWTLRHRRIFIWFFSTSIVIVLCLSYVLLFMTGWYAERDWFLPFQTIICAFMLPLWLFLHRQWALLRNPSIQAEL